MRQPTPGEAMASDPPEPIKLVEVASDADFPAQL